MSDGWNDATITVTYDDLTDTSPKQQVLVLDRATLVRNKKNELIENGQGDIAVTFDVPPDQFEGYILHHAMAYYQRPLVVVDDDGNLMILPATSILRVDIEPNLGQIEGDEPQGVTA